MPCSTPEQSGWRSCGRYAMQTTPAKRRGTSRRGSCHGSAPHPPPNFHLRMAGREKRKRRRKTRERNAARPPPVPGATKSNAVPAAAGERKPSRDDLAREQLVPLHEGERPHAVTIAAIVAALLALSNLVGLIAGVEIRGNS